MARLKLSKAHEYLRYSERKLDEAKTPEQRDFWQAKAAFYRSALDGRCQRCGRELTDEVSRQRGYGSECVKQVPAEQVAS